MLAGSNIANAGGWSLRRPFSFSLPYFDFFLIEKWAEGLQEKIFNIRYKNEIEDNYEK